MHGNKKILIKEVYMILDGFCSLYSKLINYTDVLICDNDKSTCPLFTDIHVEYLISS